MSHEAPQPSAHRKDNPPNAHCSFCGRPRALTGPMVEGPNDVYICVNCVLVASKIAEDYCKQARETLAQE
jgi:hypothetical protein